MVGLAAMAVFTGAMALALAAIWSTVAPEWRRIARLATGHVETSTQYLADFALADRRMVVRRWATAPVSMPRRQRAA